MTRNYRALIVASALLIVGTLVSPIYGRQAIAAPGDPSIISGTAMRDTNANGALDPGETPLPDVAVELIDTATGAVVATAITDVNGDYEFDELPAGDYVVSIDAPLNFVVQPLDPPVNSFTPTVGNEDEATSSPIAVDGTNSVTGVDALIRPRPEISVGPFGPGTIDGTAPFDVDGTCSSPTDTAIDGTDCGPDNGILRSQDVLTTVWSVTANNFEPGSPPLEDVIFEQTITPGPGSVVNFSEIPVACIAPPNGPGGDNPVSSIVTNPDGSITLLCNLGDFAEAAQVSFSTSIIPDGASENGSTFTVDQKVYSNSDDGQPAAVPDEDNTTLGPYQVSSAPRFDLSKTGFYNQDVTQRDVGFGLEPGYITYVNIKVATDRTTGVESITQPFTFREVISATTSDGVTPYPIEYHVTQCTPQPTGWGTEVWGRENIRATRPLGEHVIDSGVCTFVRDSATDPTSDYTFSINGADMSGTRYPTQTIGGTSLAAGPFYSIAHRVQIWIPFRSIDAEDGTLGNGNGSIQLSNSFEDFDPSSVSGTSNFGDGFEPGYNGDLMPDGTRSNNLVGPTTFELRTAGSWAKYFRGRQNDAGTSAPLLSTQSGSHTGDGELEPGETLVSYIPFGNRGSQPLSNPMACDIFDNTTLQLIDRGAIGGTAGTYAYVGTHSGGSFDSSKYVVEYANYSFGADDPLDGPTAGSPDYDPTSGRYNGDWSTMRSLRCDDPSTNGWHTDPNLVTGGIDGVNAVRARVIDPAATTLDSSQWIRFVTPLAARDTFNGGPHAGQLIPTGTVLANFGSVRSDEWSPDWTARNYQPAPETTNGDGDRVTLSRTKIRLQKNTLVPATAVGTSGATLAGNQIIWQLTAAVQSGLAVPGDATNTVIRDVLPPEATYNSACTAAYPGGTPAGLVEPNTDMDGNPAPGYTRLTWILGDVTANTPIPPRIFCTDTDSLAPNGTSVVNEAEISADNVVYNASTQEDTHSIQLQQVGSMQASKSVDVTLDDLDDSQVYTMSFANFSGAFEIDPPVLIDVFSHQDDGLGSLNERTPPSDFTGSFELLGPPTATFLDGSSPTGTPIGYFEYSADDPTTIDYNPDANTAAGTTIWCTESGGVFSNSSGAAGTCPASFADVTAIKYTSNYPLAPDGNPEQGHEITYTMNANGNEPGDLYTNRFGLDSPTLPPDQFLVSNNVSVEIASFSIGDFIFADADVDGMYTSSIDVPVPDGVAVILRDATTNAIVDVTDTTALSNGRYLFDRLGSGDYYIEIPASQFAPGGILENWVVSINPAAENDDLNESDDHHAFTTGSETVDGVRTGSLTLSAIPPAPGGLPVGLEPSGDNSGFIPDSTIDSFSNLTLDLGLVGPPAIDIQKEVCSLADNSCDVDADLASGGWVESTVVDFTETARWRIVVTNTGYQNLNNVEVTDTVEADCAADSTTNAALSTIVPNQVVAWTCDTTFLTDDRLNTATVTADPAIGDEVTDSDSAEAETPPSDPDIAVVKRVNTVDANTAPGLYVADGGILSWTYSVTNPGTVPLDDVQLVDDGGTPSDPTDDWTITEAALVSGDTDGDGLLDSSETWEFVAPATGVAPVGQYNNWVTVTGDPVSPDGEVTDSDPANAFGASPGIGIIKSVNGADANTAATGPEIAGGGAVTWTYSVTNEGNVPLTVSVSDDNGTAAGGDDFAPTYVSGDANDDGLLDLTETWTYQASGTAVLGDYVNNAVATGVGPVVVNEDGSTSPGESVTADDPAHYHGFEAKIALVKTTNTVDADTPTGPYVDIGGPVTWTYTVTNPGNVALSSVSIVDDAGTPANATDNFAALYISGDTNTDGLLDPTETWTFVASGTGKADQYANTAVVTGRPPASTNPDGSTTASDPVTDSAIDHHFGINPGIEIVKVTQGTDNDTAPGVFVPVGDPVTWTYTVTNTGNIALSGVSVSDDNGTPSTGDDIAGTYTSGDTNGDGFLDITETWIFTASGTATSGQYTNAATASGTPPDIVNPDGTSTPSDPVTDTAVDNHFGSEPGIALVKTTNTIDSDVPTGPYVPDGGPVTWTYTVTNTGNVPLQGVTVADDAGTPADGADDITGTYVSGDTNGDGLLNLTETWVFTASGSAISGQYQNTATASGSGPDITEPDGTVTPGVPVTNDAVDHYFGSDPAVNLVKVTNTVDSNTGPGIYVPIGSVVTWTYTITNPGNVPLSGIAVVDDNGTPADPADDFPGTYMSGDTNGDNILDLTETWIFAATRPLVTSGQYNNTAVVTGQGPDTTNPDGSTTAGESVNDDDPDFAFGTDPEIAIVKTTNGVDSDSTPGVYIPDGDPVTWTYTITNPGNIALANVAVNDDAGTPTDPADDITGTYASGDTNGDGLLDVDESWIFTATGTAVTGQYTNAAITSGIAPLTTNPDGSTTTGQTVTDDTVDNYFGSDPAIAVSKVTNTVDSDVAPGVFVPDGEPVTWTYTVTNPGNVALSNVTVTDDAGTPADAADDITATYVSGDTNGDGLLDLDETWEFTASGTAIVGSYNNTAEATGNGPDTTNPDGSTTPGEEVENDAIDYYFGSDPLIDLVKVTNTVDSNSGPGIYAPIGSVVTWTYTVTNPGNVPLSNVSVVDDNGTPLDPADDFTASYMNGDANGDNILDLNETWVFAATRPNVDPGQYTNIAVVSGQGPDTTNTDGTTTTGETVNDDDPDSHFGIDPAIALVKTTNEVDSDTAPGVFISVGDPVVWTYTVTNPGNIALSNVVVSDDNGTPADPADNLFPSYVSGDANGDGLLDLDETWIYTATGTATGGEYANVAATVGTPPSVTNPDGSTSPSPAVTDTAVDHYFGTGTGIEITKITNTVDSDIEPGVYVPDGGPVTWSYTVTNIGNFPLQAVDVVDDAGTPADPADDITATYVSGDTNDDGWLDLDEAWEFTASGSAIVGQYENTATASGRGPDVTEPDGTVTEDETVTDDAIDHYFGSDPMVNLVKVTNTVDSNTGPGIYAPIGSVVTWTYTVTNPGNVPLANVVVNDDDGTPADPADDFAATYMNGDTNDNGLLDTDETWVFAATRPLVTAGQYNNTAIVTGNGPDTTNPDGSTTPGEATDDDDPDYHFGIDPGIAVAKTTNGADSDTAPGVYIPTGEPVRWIYTVSNTGNIALSDVSVVDDAGTPTDPADDFTADYVSGDTNDDGLLDTDEVWIFEATGVATDGQYLNTAEAEGTPPPATDPDGNEIPQPPITDDAVDNHFGSNPGVDVTKLTNGTDNSTPPGISLIVGDPVVWTYTVVNTGNVALANVTVTDDAGTATDPADDFTATYVSGDSNEDGLLDLDETWEFTASGVVTAGLYTNNGTVVADPPPVTDPEGETKPDEPVTDTDDDSYTGLSSGVDIEKFVDGEDADEAPGLIVPSGTEVSWTYVVTNTGEAAIMNIVVGDDDPRLVVICPSTTLLVGESMECTAGPLAIDGGQYTNIGTVSGTPANPPVNEGDPFTPVIDPSTGQPSAPIGDDDPSNAYGSEPGIALVKDLCRFNSLAECDADVADHWADSAVVPDDGTAIWRLTVTNTGNIDLSNVELQDELAPACETVIPLLPVGESASNVCALENVSAGFVNTAAAIGTPTGVVCGDGELEDCGTPVEASDDSEVLAPPDLSIVKTASVASATVGQAVEFTLVVTNVGETEATDVMVVDTLPSQLGDVSTSSTDGTVIYDEAGHTLNWTIDVLASGESMSITYGATIKEAGSILNVAAIASEHHDPTLEDNESTVAIEVPEESLAFTGSSAWRWVYTGFGLALAGLAALALVGWTRPNRRLQRRNN